VENAITIDMNNTDTPFKGYAVSTDYELLWRLVQEGYSVPCWCFCQGMWQIANARWWDGDKSPIISSPGIGYSSYRETVYEFVSDCKMYKLHFIPPTVAD
jgi:hypothetical protein